MKEVNGEVIARSAGGVPRRRFAANGKREGLALASSCSGSELALYLHSYRWPGNWRSIRALTDARNGPRSSSLLA